MPADKKAGAAEWQLSFRRGCTNTDQILALKDTIEQCWEQGRALNVLSGPSENTTPIVGMLVAQRYQEDYTERLPVTTDGEVTGPTLGEMQITTPGAFVIRISTP